MPSDNKSIFLFHYHFNMENENKTLGYMTKIMMQLNLIISQFIAVICFQKIESFVLCLSFSAIVPGYFSITFDCYIASTLFSFIFDTSLFMANLYESTFFSDRIKIEFCFIYFHKVQQNLNSHQKILL